MEIHGEFQLGNHPKPRNRASASGDQSLSGIGEVGIGEMERVLVEQESTESTSDGWILLRNDGRDSPCSIKAEEFWPGDRK